MTTFPIICKKKQIYLVHTLFLLGCGFVFLPFGDFLLFFNILYFCKILGLYFDLMF